MSILDQAFRMLQKYPLCNHCLGRQFALLGHGIENHERGKAIKTHLALQAHRDVLNRKKKAIEILQILSTNGFSEVARQIMNKLGEPVPEKEIPKTCFLCRGKIRITEELTEKALKRLSGYEYNNFLVGTYLPAVIEEREDEFKAEFDVCYGENMRNEIGRTMGKAIANRTGKTVEFRRPEIVVLVNPMREEIKLQINPIHVAGRYRKLVRGIPQSKWLCSGCRGKGCEECNWTGKLYPESVAEIIEGPFLEETGGASTAFHASGREDIDARMLGDGRPFVIEVKSPKKRHLDLERLQETVNSSADGKIEILNLRMADKDVVRKLKIAEGAQKEYLVTMRFEKETTSKDLKLLAETLTDTIVKQRTPIRVLHRRADLTRERYIYDVTIKRLSPKKVEMRIHCQGGLYVKELVTGDEGRTDPSISGILENRAEPIELDVLDISMKDYGGLN